MFIQKLYKLFFAIVVVSVVLLAYNWYKNYQFDNNPLSQNIQKMIFDKKQETRKLLIQNYEFDLNVPILISDKIPSSLYGAAVYTNEQEIIIYLNKKRFKESLDYMINQVIPHEYAHAVMFHLNDFSKKQGGHTKKWQEICKNLNGIKCEQFVNHQDIILGKIPF